MPRFLIEDERHADWCGEFDSLEDVELELRRLAAIPWDEEPNQAPCQSWATCGRTYVVIDRGDSQTPKSSRSALNISKSGVVWHEPFRPVA
jgi:hypothetical protein